jgi:signal transduction histidine kinase
MNPGDSSLQRRFLFVAEVLGFTAIYFCCGKFGLSLALINKSISAVWPPTGVALAVLLLRGQKLWPAIFIGAFLVNITTQGRWPTALGIALGNTLEAILGAALTIRFASGSRAFERTSNIFRFVFLAAMFSTAVSATFGVTTLWLAGHCPEDQFGADWLTWWLGDMVSDLLISPVLLLWATTPLGTWRWRRVVEAIGLVLLLLWIGQSVFLGQLLASGNYPLEYLAVPPLLWAAFRFGERGAATFALIFSAIAIWGTRRGLGPFARGDANESMLLLQAFMGTITLTGLTLASLISERKRAEQGLREAQQNLQRYAQELEQRVQERTARLEESVQSLDSFCHSIAHDLRAPLRAVSGFSSELFQNYQAELDDMGKLYLERIRDSAARMDRLILDLLEYGRLNNAEVPAERVELEPAIQTALAPLESEISLKSASVQVQQPLLPVLANPAMLGQILANLLGNAIKFVPAETPPRVQVWTEKRDSMVRICVKDNGIGIKQPHLKKLFQPFVRMVNGAEYPGTGMGLAIVRKAAERMGGSAGAESAPGNGSCFWVELPEGAK